MPTWPKDNQTARNAFYGDPGKGQIEPQLVSVVPPFAMYYEGKKIKSIRFHPKAAAALRAALDEIWDYCEHDQAKVDASGASKYNGAYSHRMVRGSSTKWSNHAYGTAIDLNAGENALGVKVGNMPSFIIDAFCRQGAMWGGWYKTRPDWMHFEFVDNGGHQPRSTRPAWPKPPKFMEQPDAPEGNDNALSGVEFEDDSPIPVSGAATQPVTPAGTPLNVQPEKSTFDLEVQVVQQALIGRGYHEVGNADGLDGGKTTAGIAAFMKDRGKPSDGNISPVVKAELNAAVAEGWTRPISPTRANATAADIAPKVASVNQTWYTKLWAWLLALGSSATAAFKSVFGDYNDPSSYIYSIKSFFSSIPGEFYFLAVAGVAVFIIIQASRSTNATVAAYQKGEIN